MSDEIELIGEKMLREYVTACHAALPTVVSVRLGAKLSGHKADTFRARILPHVRMAGGRGVNLPLMELLTGRPIGVLEYLQAQRSLDRVRRRDREAKAAVK